MSWIPIDIAAHTITEFILSGVHCDVMNIVHPHPVPWNDVFSTISSTLTSDLEVNTELVPYSVWFSRLEQLTLAPTQNDLESIVSCYLFDSGMTLKAFIATARVKNSTFLTRFR